MRAAIDEVYESDYAQRIRQAGLQYHYELIDAQGIITGDLKGKTSDPAAESVVDMYGFLDAIEGNLPYVAGGATVFTHCTISRAFMAPD
jgi:hypothetical protein